jgi:hypothetical protein
MLLGVSGGVNDVSIATRDAEFDDALFLSRLGSFEEVNSHVRRISDYSRRHLSLLLPEADESS